jgi:hypothetical protein
MVTVLKCSHKSSCEFGDAGRSKDAFRVTWIQSGPSEFRLQSRLTSGRTDVGDKDPSTHLAEQYRDSV